MGSLEILGSAERLDALRLVSGDVADAGGADSIELLEIETSSGGYEARVEAVV